MSAVAIDLNTLDDLFNNQKRMDDVFNSVFDDDFLLDSASDSSDLGYEASSGSQSSGSNEIDYLSFDTDEYVGEKRSIAYIIMPVVLEVAALYYGITYFIL